MDAILHQCSSLSGALAVGPDKAICHRAVLLAAVADGETEIRPWPPAEDCRRTLELIRALGVSAAPSGGGMRIEGRGRDGLRGPSQELCCGESGTTLRLAAGLLAGQPFTSRLTAGAALSRRPMRRIVEPLCRMGARIDASAPGSNQAERYPPLVVHGARPLHAIRYELPVASAQVKSAILLAALFADGPTTVIEPQATRDHTERMLGQFGRSATQRGSEVTLEPGRLRSPGTLELPGDISSAAFFLVAASIVPGSRLRLEGVGLNPSRTKLLDVLSRMGASIRITDHEDAWEPRGTLLVEARPLRGITVEAMEVPGMIDELPIAMVAAACASGLSRFQGIAELRLKETDRVRSMVSGLTRLGARVRVMKPDAVEIEGGRRLYGVLVDSAGDHRTAMSLAVAGLVASGTTTVQGAECVRKSFPEFFDQLRSLTGSPTGKTVDKT